MILTSRVERLRGMSPLEHWALGHGGLKQLLGLDPSGRIAERAAQNARARDWWRAAGHPFDAVAYPVASTWSGTVRFDGQ